MKAASACSTVLASLESEEELSLELVEEADTPAEDSALRTVSCRVLLLVPLWQEDENWLESSVLLVLELLELLWPCDS
jgi:hypothetical protein